MIQRMKRQTKHETSKRRVERRNARKARLQLMLRSLRRLMERPFYGAIALSLPAADVAEVPGPSAPIFDWLPKP